MGDRRSVVVTGGTFFLCLWLALIYWNVKLLAVQVARVADCMAHQQTGRGQCR